MNKKGAPTGQEFMITTTHIRRQCHLTVIRVLFLTGGVSFKNQDSVSKFTGAYTQIQNMNQSGVPEQDKHAPKWCDFIASQNKKQKTSSNARVCALSDLVKVIMVMKRRVSLILNRGNQDQLVGRRLYSWKDALTNLRKARGHADELKEIKKKERNDARLEVEKARLEQKRESDNRRHEIMEKELEHKQRMEDERVINIDLRAMREPQLIFYKQWQEEILQDRIKIYMGGEEGRKYEGIVGLHNDLRGQIWMRGLSNGTMS
ncbi:hypothetical protein EJB05_29422 [Eragrostis curvula]|uniref:No apical meristem-associated C-terminal domain-containing protein n=1 Tax=Eragrostis curvula TaxID=38414 RepID=A0A5J9USV3_9POAL|nr:hypothetical protein EJB05_56611 [Eragrostis curvula]TVU26853.1 hypothetical protein EJB05_29422 [Eragrostis curvula]